MHSLTCTRPHALAHMHSPTRTHSHALTHRRLSQGSPRKSQGSPRSRDKRHSIDVHRSSPELTACTERLRSQSSSDLHAYIPRRGTGHSRHHSVPGTDVSELSDSELSDSEAYWSDLDTRSSARSV